MFLIYVITVAASIGENILFYKRYFENTYREKRKGDVSLHIH